jgi:hypothetical protein
LICFEDCWALLITQEQLRNYLFNLAIAFGPIAAKEFGGCFLFIRWITVFAEDAVSMVAFLQT